MGARMQVRLRCLGSQKNAHGGKFLLAKGRGIVYKYSTHLSIFAMKRFILPFAAALCASFAASATDATDARLWMQDNAKVDVHAWNEAKNITRSTWQYVTFPVQVEGALKGKDSAPHFIPGMKVRVYVLFVVNEREKEYALLEKELNYVEIPLESKALSDKNKAGATVKVGVFVSPANAYRIAPKDGNVSKKVAAVAVEATFKDAPCVRRESGSRSIVQHVVLAKGLDLKANWWRNKSSFKSDCGAVLHSIAETPYAARYIDLDMPALSPMYGSGMAADSSSSTSSTGTGGISDSDTGTGGPVSVTDDGDSSDSSATEEEDSSSKGSKRGSKRNKGGKKRR